MRWTIGGWSRWVELVNNSPLIQNKDPTVELLTSYNCTSHKIWDLQSVWGFLVTWTFSHLQVAQLGEAVNQTVHQKHLAYLASPSCSLRSTAHRSTWSSGSHRLPLDLWVHAEQIGGASKPAAGTGAATHSKSQTPGEKILVCCQWMIRLVVVCLKWYVCLGMLHGTSEVPPT